MELSPEDRWLLAALEPGLALSPRPYAALGRAAGMSEAEVLGRLRGLLDSGVIRRLGVIVRHRELGYDANAMVVWDVPEDRVGDAGRRLAELPFITLCYRRRPHPPEWPYNLYCMIHGRSREAVRELVEEATRRAGLEGRPREVLFSRRRFKQTGARYSAGSPAARLARREAEAGEGSAAP